MSVSEVGMMCMSNCGGPHSFVYIKFMCNRMAIHYLHRVFIAYMCLGVYTGNCYSTNV